MSVPHDPTSQGATPEKSEGGDRYQILSEIARGGMGVVLRGRDLVIGRDVAIKLLLEEHVNRPEVVRRFIEEAQIAGQLQHPGIVTVYDLGRFGERPFFTMKLVKGRTLADILGEQTDPATERLRLLNVALQVAQALAYAHAKGVIHRDLKPADIMVGAFGEVQVLDWGLAKVLPEGGIADEEKAFRHHQSSDKFGTDPEGGSLPGTPAYMPPEQANGGLAFLDRRADVFRLGAILCEVLTGKPPYVGSSEEEVRRKAVRADLADANARLGTCGADAELIALTRACLAQKASDRPKDAAAVAEELVAYLDGVQGRQLAEAGVRVRAVEMANRRLSLALAGTVLLGLSLCGGVWLWVRADRDAQLTRAVNAARSGIRDEASLANLSPEERARIFELLTDVAALLKKAETPAKKEGK